MQSRRRIAPGKPFPHTPIPRFRHLSNDRKVPPAAPSPPARRSPLIHPLRFVIPGVNSRQISGPFHPLSIGRRLMLDGVAESGLCRTTKMLATKGRRRSSLKHCSAPLVSEPIRLSWYRSVGDSAPAGSKSGLSLPTPRAPNPAPDSSLLPATTGRRPSPAPPPPISAKCSHGGPWGCACPAPPGG